MTSLSATIGTGNIAGVAGAIAVGGPGAVFWMWIIAIFGIATKYAEAVLAVQFRETDGDGNHVGGPMYYIRNGLGSGWSWMAGLFALFGMLAGFGIGNGVQAFEVSSALSLIGIPEAGHRSRFGRPGLCCRDRRDQAHRPGGLRHCSVDVDPLRRWHASWCCWPIWAGVPEAFATIFSNAFSGKAAAGGALGQVVLMGFKRGIFSNEAGLGSAPIAHAAATNR